MYWEGEAALFAEGKSHCRITATYGVSGIKTFLVSHHGVVYEKDLGNATATPARQITRFNPDKRMPVRGPCLARVPGPAASWAPRRRCTTL